VSTSLASRLVGAAGRNPAEAAACPVEADDDMAQGGQHSASSLNLRELHRRDRPLTNVPFRLKWGGGGEFATRFHEFDIRTAREFAFGPRNDMGISFNHLVGSRQYRCRHL
jgi:hypothetical protein